MNSLGANPLAAFPNDKLKPGEGAKWAAPQQEDPVDELRNAAMNTDWGALFSRGRTKALASPAWAASEERCQKLKSLCTATGAQRVLEIGAFCGVASLAMAEVLPSSGSILSLEFDPFLVDFGLDIRVKSESFWKISHMVGPARESLKALVQRVQDPDWKPFDLAIIDADKAGVVDYFEILVDTVGFMNNEYTLVVDVTPFKGQIFTPYVRYGKPDEWVISSGQSEINNLRKCAGVASRGLEISEASGFLQARKRAKNYSIGANPFAAFPNEHSSSLSEARWAAPQEVVPAVELRNAVKNTDWSALFVEGKTKNRVEASWSASDERCDRLKALCESTGATRVLEIGSFCGVAALSMAEALPHNSQLICLELDPFVAEFGQDIKAKSNDWKKVSQMIGSACDSLQILVQRSQNPDEAWQPFDFVVIDADKVGMLEYFRVVFETPGMLAPSATICVDITPFKGQLFVQYVKGKLDDWIVKSGQDSIDSFLSFVRSLEGVTVQEANGLVTVQRGKTAVENAG